MQLILQARAAEATALRVGSDLIRSTCKFECDQIIQLWLETATGNVAANLFQGVATQARYADLAEKYTTEDRIASRYSSSSMHGMMIMKLEPASASNHVYWCCLN